MIRTGSACLTSRLNPYSIRSSLLRMLATPPFSTYQGEVDGENGNSFDVRLFTLDKTARRQHPPVVNFYNQTLPKAKAVVYSAIQKYGLDKLAIAFNGGKDCTCILHIVMDELKALTNCSEIPVVYFRSRPQFLELEEFMRDKVKSENLNYIVYEGPLKESLARFKLDYPGVEGIFMGTRCKDPGSKDLDHFSRTDPDWPDFMRILPILHFSYHDVWLYLKEFDVYYCSLYNDGYTSIGWEGNTLRNPKLRIQEEGDVVKYLPAYMLKSPDDERSSRE